MNKKLLAVAVGAAMVAAATAATAADEPTLYAKIHLSIDSMDNGGPLDSDDGIFVSSNSSRLGIKGAEDLGNGLSAVYKYEMSTNYSTAGAVMGDRNAYLGLKGGFGQIIAGRHDMPFKTVGRKHDLFGDTIGDHRSITRAKLGGDDYADRRSDVIMYSNTFGAVGVKLAYAPEEAGVDTTDTSIGLDFKQGPLSVMYAHETHGNGNLTGTEDSSGDILAGTYKMGSMTFAAGYMAASDVGGSTADSSQVSGFTLGGAFKSGMNTFKLQYTSAETDLSDTASTLIALGMDHSMSKMTKVYVMYAGISNDSGAAAGFTNTGHDATVTAVAGEDSTGISLGMIHKF